MSARTVIEHALRAYFADSCNPDGLVETTLTKYDAERPAAVLAEDAPCPVPGGQPGQARELLFLFAMAGKVDNTANRAAANARIDAYRAEVLANGQAETLEDLRERVFAAVRSFHIDRSRSGGYDRQLTEHILAALTRRGEGQ